MKFILSIVFMVLFLTACGGKNLGSTPGDLSDSGVSAVASGASFQ